VPRLEQIKKVLDDGTIKEIEEMDRCLRVLLKSGIAPNFCLFELEMNFAELFLHYSYCFLKPDCV
jgi:hypothetical protein